MVFSSGTVSLCSIFVMLGSLVMFVSSHFNPRRLSAELSRNLGDDGVR
jgi:hypothetical protein